MDKRVTFCDKPPFIIYEPKHLIDDLRHARKSDYMQRQADKCRMERLLLPIFNPQHRDKMRIHLRELKVTEIQIISHGQLD